MVFGGPVDGECERYSTEAEAIDGHAAVVASVREREAEHARLERIRAAAPELLEALERLVNWYGTRTGGVFDDLLAGDEQPPEIQAAMEVLAEAKGEAK